MKKWILAGAIASIATSPLAQNSLYGGFGTGSNPNSHGGSGPPHPAPTPTPRPSTLSCL